MIIDTNRMYQVCMISGVIQYAMAASQYTFVQ